MLVVFLVINEMVKTNSVLQSSLAICMCTVLSHLLLVVEREYKKLSDVEQHMLAAIVVLSIVLADTI